ncbi:MAG: hypothetical protein Q9164_001751 [Protoblastenia rupestris]
MASPPKRYPSLHQVPSPRRYPSPDHIIPPPEALSPPRQSGATNYLVQRLQSFPSSFSPSTSSSGGSSSGLSWTSLPPESRQTSIPYSQIVPTSSKAEKVAESQLERTDVATAPAGWKNDARMIELSVADRTRLSEAYCMHGLIGRLAMEDHHPWLLISDLNRFFLWSRSSNDLFQIRTPYNLLGIFRALDHPSPRLELVRIDPETLAGPTADDIERYPAELVPEGWSDEERDLLCGHEAFDLGIYGLHARRPIFSYENSSGSDDMEFFRCEQHYYIYRLCQATLYQILEPDMSQSQNFELLSRAPDFEGMELVKVAWAEVHGGPRRLREEEIPAGWTQGTLGVDIEGDMPEFCLTSPPPTRVLTSRGETEVIHLVEWATQCYFWAPQINRFVLIDEPGGLYDVLELLRAGTRLPNLVQENF